MTRLLLFLLLVSATPVVAQNLAADLPEDRVIRSMGNSFFAIQAQQGRGLSEAALLYAQVTQSGAGGHLAIQQQHATGTPPVPMEATIEQFGIGHRAEQRQIGLAGLSASGLVARILQEGAGNEAIQLQDGAGLFASVIQIGGEEGANRAVQEQTGFDLYSVIDQEGHGNTATVTQTGVGLSAFVTQRGTGNTVTATQSN